MVKAQEYFNNKYKKNVTYLKVEEPISDKLTGSLDLSEFTSLKWISITKQELTGLTLNSPDLEVINLAENKIKSLSWLSTLPNKNSLTKLHLFNNEITDVDFNLLTSFPNLASVNLGANPLSYLHVDNLTSEQSELLKSWINDKKINITSLKNNLSLNLLGQLVELKEENEELRGRKEQSQNEKLKAQIARLEEENTNLRKAQAEAMKQIRIGLEKLEVNIEVAPK
ncbi:MAG: hypothetical protein MRERV_3c080 [Mycoplasmataceae bacterium RV_VA103A]|nr:MAG: hypothetical protein MRERV_3c080 [Mycoplasmataceae bacterium RV_VA103A]